MGYIHTIPVGSVDLNMCARSSSEKTQKHSAHVQENFDFMCTRFDKTLQSILAPLQLYFSLQTSILNLFSSSRQQLPLDSPKPSGKLWEILGALEIRAGAWRSEHAHIPASACWKTSSGHTRRAKSHPQPSPFQTSVPGGEQLGQNRFPRPVAKHITETLPH